MVASFHEFIADSKKKIEDGSILHSRLQDYNLVHRGMDEKYLSQFQ
jgi:hypothetical protein